MFNCKINKIINGFEIKVFELDTEHSDLMRTAIKNKVQSMKVYKDASHADFLPPNVNAEFKAQFKAKILEIVSPKDHKIKWFDVKRAFATEFMSQLLLEKEYNCIFHEESDKKINVTPVNVDKPIPGVDVVGLQESEEDFKFVVCEVKASQDARIPCSSSKDLFDDIQKAINDEKRVNKEVLQYLAELASVQHESIEKIIEFLTNMLMQESSQKTMLEKIIFFPFMIRNNPDIINNENLNDFNMFDKNELSNIDLNGVIWSFNEDIDEFCINIYNEALEEIQ